MKDYYRAGKNICSHLRSKGYDVKFIQNFSWLTFTISNTFLFCTTLDILPEAEVEKILIEIIKEKENVHIPTKDKRA